jgi:ubiquinone/menaquinone biosynthesis C-methylase UbiE
MVNVEKNWDNLSDKYFIDADYSKFPFNLLSQFKGIKFLEAGSGDGEIAIFMNKNGNVVSGLEISNKFLNISTKKVKDLNLRNIEFMKGDVRKMPFKDKSFDVVFSGGVVEHFDETFESVKEHVRVLKKGGYLLIGVPCKEGLHYPLKKVMQIFGLWTIGFEKSYTKKFFKNQLINLNLEIVKQVNIPIEATNNQSKIRFYITYLISKIDKLIKGTHMMYFLCEKQ